MPSNLKNSLGYYLKAKYRVSPVSGNYYSYQYDNEKGNGQDGYAGVFGKAIDRADCSGKVKELILFLIKHIIANYTPRSSQLR